MRIQSNKVLLISKRSEVFTFCKELIKDRLVLSESVINRNANSGTEPVIFEPSGFDFSDKGVKSFLSSFSKIALLLLPADISQDCKNYLEANFRFVISYPICGEAFKHYFIRYCGFFKENFLFHQNCFCSFRSDESCPYEKTESICGFFSGNSKLIKQTREEIKKAAALDSPVLILGETGSGKSTAARLIHDLSSRKSKHLETITMSALSDSSANSAFFGTQTGVFTDVQSNPGHFQKADRGSLFIDEIGTATLGVQAMLLNVIENGEFSIVGTSVTQKVDFRLISATNSDIKTMMETNDFRADLFYRISDTIIKIPSLRQRPEDIVSTSLEYLRGKEKDISNAALNRLMDYQWPGNVRELLQCLKRAFINCNKDTIDADDLNFGLFD